MRSPLRNFSWARPGACLEACRIGAFGERGGIELAHEGFARGGEPGLQAAARRQRASPAIAAKTFDQGMLAFERAHDLAERDCLRWSRQRKAAADAALGRDEAAF